MNTHFILVEPAVPENIGATARAIKTMGFASLRLVKPANHLADEARWLAHASNEILENAQVYSSLNDAILDLDFTIATTAKKRTSKFDYYSPEDARTLIIKKSELISNIGIIFGREESGLTNDEVAMCSIASSIPLANPYPSINLAQSVMLYAYVFSHLKPTFPEMVKPETKSYRNLIKRIDGILKQIGFAPNSNIYNRIFERLGTISADDANLLHSISQKLNEFKKD